MKYCCLLLVFASLLSIDPSAAVGQEELKPEVPALDEFHTVIFKIWHTAWPAGDAQMLADLVPEVRDLGEKLAAAELPGILRDKQAAWEENIADLRSILEEYNSAAVPLDSERILDAAERLHAQYEKLVMLIRPPLPELEAFHAVLYMLYHHYVPDGDKHKIDSCAAELKVRMAALDTARLPERLSGKAADFTKARSSLSSAVSAFVASVGGGEMKEIEAKLETMHTAYQSLEKVFD